MLNLMLNQEIQKKLTHLFFHVCDFCATSYVEFSDDIPDDSESDV